MSFPQIWHDFKFLSAHVELFAGSCDVFVCTDHSAKKVCELCVSGDGALDSAADGLLFEQLDLALVIDLVKKFVGQKYFCVFLKS